jgi:hypothetical protein
VNTEDDLIVQSDFPAASIEVNVWAKLDAAALQTEGNHFFCKAGLDTIHRTIHKVHPKISGVGPSKANIQQT